MAYKKFNATETEYTGTVDADLIIGNDLGNFIDAGEGDNVVFGGIGADIILAGSGNDIIYSGGGADIIDAGDGNNIVFGADDADFITAGAGVDQLYGNGGDDNLFGGAGNDSLNGGAGNDILSGEESTAGDETVAGNVYITSSGIDAAYGGDGNDTFVIGGEIDGTLQIDAGVSGLDNEGIEAVFIDAQEDESLAETVVYDTVTGEFVTIDDLETALQIETDVRLNLAYRPGSTALSSFATTIGGYNAVDTLEFTQSGDFSESLAFAGIERIEVASGKNIVLSAEQIANNGESLDLGFLNPGVHFYGVAGGPKESVTVMVEYAEVEFLNENIVIGQGPLFDEDGNPIYELDETGNPILDESGLPIQAIGDLYYDADYEGGDFQLDDFTVADLFHNIDAIYDAQTNSTVDSYVRIDGSNNSETVYGSEGVDNATMRLGNDVYYGNGGNDLLIGHGGADKLYGGTGDDVFVIGGFGSGTQGTTSKVDDGKAEWVSGDLIVGGAGVDTLRITTGIGANTAAKGTITLTNANFKSMEVVQVGGTAGRINTEDGALQLINDHYYHRAGSTVANLADTLGNNGGSINNVVINASGVTTNGLRFEGNADKQTFIGTTKADVFVGNGGNDVLTGKGGADKFVFGQVHEQKVTGDATTEQFYTDTAFNLTGVDTITDFARGTDKIQLLVDQYTSLTGGITNANVRVNNTGTAQDANDYLLYNTTTKTLSYDADGNGAGAKVDIAILTGVNNFAASDVIVA